jgi:hypothetical protein
MKSRSTSWVVIAGLVLAVAIPCSAWAAKGLAADHECCEKSGAQPASEAGVRCRLACSLEEPRNPFAAVLSGAPQSAAPAAVRSAPLPPPFRGLAAVSLAIEPEPLAGARFYVLYRRLLI